MYGVCSPSKTFLLYSIYFKHWNTIYCCKRNEYSSKIPQAELYFSWTELAAVLRLIDSFDDSASSTHQLQPEEPSMRLALLFQGVEVVQVSRPKSSHHGCWGAATLRTAEISWEQSHSPIEGFEGRRNCTLLVPPRLFWAKLSEISTHQLSIGGNRRKSAFPDRFRGTAGQRRDGSTSP